MKYPSLLLCAALCFVFGSSPPLLADEPVYYVVPRSEPHVTLHYQALLGKDPSTVQLLSSVSPSRGSLVAISAGLVYAPTAAFADWGTDNFRFTYVDLLTESVHEVVVHLIADLDYGESLDRDTTSGGNTVLDLKIPPPCAVQDCDLIDSAPILLAEGVSEPGSGSVGFSIWQRIEPDDTSSFQVEALLADGSKVTTGFIPQGGADKLILDWWLSRARSRNGGFFLRLGETTVATMSGLDNHHYLGIKWSYFKQYAEANGGSIHRTHSSRSDLQPIAFPPRFADTFEDSTVDDWPTTPGVVLTTNALAIDADAAVDGNYGLRVDLSTGGAVLVDERPAAQTNFRARFHLDLGSTCTIPPFFRTGSVALLGGKSTAQASIFTVALEQVPNGSYRLRASSFNDGNMVPIAGTLVLTNPQVTVDVTWWTAEEPSVPGGGLRVVLHEDGNTTELDLPLANVQQQLESVQFGALGAGNGAICLDEYESWWR